MIKRLIKKINRFYQIFHDRNYFHPSYSQDGEDMILRTYFQNKPIGFYIDIGAHHPKKLSNTYVFYKMGWTGINIDAMPGSMIPFNEIRKRDINLEKAVSDVDTELTYYVFNEPALNGFSEEISKERDRNSIYKIIDEVKIKTEKLSSILDKYLPSTIKTIDFMSIDVEGFDLNVLKSNNWQKYRPKVILVELLDFELFDKDPIFIFLKNIGYSFFAKTRLTFVFTDTFETN
jgi:FkbM family methyltransferase